jgi:hypothetical protein
MWLGVGMAAVAFVYLIVRGPARVTLVRVSSPDDVVDALSVG